MIRIAGGRTAVNGDDGQPLSPHRRDALFAAQARRNEKSAVFESESFPSDRSGGPAGIRTPDQGIMSPLL